MKIIPFRRKIIPYRFMSITWYLIGAQLVMLLAGILFPQVIFGYLAATTQGIEHGWLWQLVSFGFVENIGNINNLWILAFNLLALYFFGIQVEHELGSWEFLLLWVGLSVGTALLSFVVFKLLGFELFLYGSTGIVSAVMLVYASFNPWQSIYVFGIIPVRAPVLMAIVTGILLLSLLFSGPASLVHLFAIGIAYLYMLLRHRKNFFTQIFVR